MDLIRAQYESCEAYDQDKIQAAIDILTRIEESKLSCHLYYNLFIFYTKLEDTSQATDALDRCLKRDANHALCHFQLGMIQFVEKDYQGKLKMLITSII